jgi:hypothetical protein
MMDFDCRQSIFDNTICIDINPSKTHPKLHKHNLRSIRIKHNSNCILLFKLIANPTINPPILSATFHQILPNNRILHIITSTLMPDAKPSFAINHKQVIVFVMPRWYHLYPADICMEVKSIHEG